MPPRKVAKPKKKSAKPWAGFSVAKEISVRWRDLDAYNHVTNSVYLNYFEEARIALFQKVPLLKKRLHGDDKYGSTLIRSEIDYKRQAFLFDKLIVAARFSAVRKVFIDTEYFIFNKKTKQLIVEGKAINVLIEKKNFKLIRVPKDLEEEIYSLS